jgi:AraC family transcriptional regulator
VLQQALAARRRDGATAVGQARNLAAGRGWRVLDEVCTAGPDDRPFEERHAGVSISLVLQGSFTYRSGLGRAVMTPGALLLGDAGACFQCGHGHGQGDRCLSFRFDRDLVSAAAESLGAGFDGFSAPRMLSSPRTLRLCLEAADAPEAIAEENAFAVLSAVLPTALEAERPPPTAARDERRALDLARHLDGAFRDPVTLGDLAGRAGLSRFHLLRTFRRVTGWTPYGYVLRRRLECAAAELTDPNVRVTDVAYDCGFEDLSNFTRSFKAAFGVSPGAWRRRRAGRRDIRPFPRTDR